VRGTPLKTAILVLALASFALNRPGQDGTLPPSPGAGIFLMLSDIHFDPFPDPAIMERLGANLRAGCQTRGSQSFSQYKSDTNYTLLKSTLDYAVATAAKDHRRYDYVIITGDFLAHEFDTRYQQCVAGDEEAYRKFASDTIIFVSNLVKEAFPGVPVFAALGNNDSDQGDYEMPSGPFRTSVSHNWSAGWGNLSLPARSKATRSFVMAGYYAVPHPTVPGTELIILNTNFWTSADTQACSETDPDPGGQFGWLAEELGKVKRAKRTATLIMHIPPGINTAESVGPGEPALLWTDRCTEKFMAEMNDFPRVVREIYAGHIHRDDFRLLKDRAGKPLCPVHIVPAISPVYGNNPAVEIGWYDRSNGELTNYALLYLDLGTQNPIWATEYVFAHAYGYPRLSLTALEDLSRRIHAGNPSSGVGKQYSSYYAAGAKSSLTPEKWGKYACAQTETTISSFGKCANAAAAQEH
jgi:sphingomyelin phosphodiesterase acid-like 3